AATGAAGGRAGRERQPLATALQSAPIVGVVLQSAVHVDGYRPCGLAATGRARGRLFCRRAPPLTGVASLTFGLALLATICPLTGGLGHGLAMGAQPCMGAGRGWPPLHLAAFAANMQQEHIERFYAIQSHHTQFKTNLSHENLGSDTTVRKPQRVHHMRSENQNKILVSHADQIVVEKIGVTRKT
ncbi:hypothetical protein GW17_00056094, partial [Ensete ventricosum]